MKRIVPFVVAGILAAGSHMPFSAASAALSSEQIVSGLNRPVYLAAPDGDARLFIVEQRGVIRIYENGALVTDPFLDIDSLVAAVSGNSEQGLLGLAFDPDFANNDRFFVYYTNTSGNTVIARYEVESGNPNKAAHSSAAILFTHDQPFSNHNAGWIDFGPDGYLYFGLGDGGSAGDPGNRAQNTGNLLGKILRIDASTIPYTVPADNPFVGNGSVLDEIWAIGVRNPWRCSFDRTTGDLWIGDVGQGVWEEVDFQSASSIGGENYGWRLMEGLHCYDPPSGCEPDTLDLPIHEYSHSFGCSVIGGYVYRGAEVPELFGKYLFSDFCGAPFWTLERIDDTTAVVTDVASEVNPTFAINSPSSFGEDGFGELYIVNRGGGTTGGAIWKVIADPTSVGESPSFPDAFRLGRITPNPAAGSMRFEISLDKPGPVEVSVYDVSGRLVRSLPFEQRSAGDRLLEWDGRDDSGREVSSGAYFVRVESEGRRVTRRVNVVR